MAIPHEKLASCDPVWAQLRNEAQAMADDEPALAGFVHATILKHDRLENALSYHLARKLGGEDLDPLLARETFEEALNHDPAIGEAIRADLSAVLDRDPACHSFVEAFLYYKGFHALESYRIGLWLWRQNRKALALFFPQEPGQGIGKARRYGFALVQLAGNLPLDVGNVLAVLGLAHGRPLNGLPIPVGNPVSARPPLMG